MGTRLQIIVSTLAGAALLPLLAVVIELPGFMPSARLAALARDAHGPDAGRDAIVATLHRLRVRRRARQPYDWVTTANIGRDASRFRSWRNDEGFLARTDIRCRPGGRCTVAPHALIPERWAALLVPRMVLDVTAGRSSPSPPAAPGPSRR